MNKIWDKVSCNSQTPKASAGCFTCLSWWASGSSTKGKATSLRAKCCQTPWALGSELAKWSVAEPATATPLDKERWIPGGWLAYLPMNYKSNICEKERTSHSWTDAILLPISCKLNSINFLSYYHQAIWRKKKSNFQNKYVGRRPSRHCFFKTIPPKNLLTFHGYTFDQFFSFLENSW